jgi:hypothetical protein
MNRPYYYFSLKIGIAKIDIIFIPANTLGKYLPDFRNSLLNPFSFRIVKKIQVHNNEIAG